MRMLIGSLATETNTFSPLPTGRAAFEETGYFRDDGSQHADAAVFGGVLALWRDRGVAAGFDVVESICAFAQPGGRVTAEAYADFCGQLLEDARRAAPLDMVVLCLHGAMAAQDIDDCEGDLLRRLRAIVGPDCVIGAELDLHCHLTPAMLAAADILVSYKEYPHTDIRACAAEVFELCRRTYAGEIKPVTRAVDCGTIGLWRTALEPGKSIVRAMQEMEQRGEVLSISFGHGFPWADVEDVGARVWAITNGDAVTAERCARSIAEQVVATRAAAATKACDVDAALDLALRSDGLCVLADQADNAGGGAASDSTFVLRRLIERGISGAAVGVLWDPIAAAICRDAGRGAQLQLRIGGKCGVASGAPLDVYGRVVSVIDDHVPPGLSGAPARLGLSVRVDVGGVSVILSSIRSQVLSRQMFEDHGVSWQGLRLVAVKSMEHFRSAFAPVAREIIYVDTPGSLSSDFARLPYTKRRLIFWPRDQQAGVTVIEP